MKTLAFLLCAAAFGEDAGWKALEAWAGEWVAEGPDAQGASNSKDAQGASNSKDAQGASTFKLELDGRIFVRRNFAEYPAAEGRPASRHEDLMVFSPGPPLSAVYWDNEGHTIHYNVTASSDRLELVSTDAGPRYRLTYRRTAADRTTLTFEVAPPGQPFKPYISASLRRRH